MSIEWGDIWEFRRQEYRSTDNSFCVQWSYSEVEGGRRSYREVEDNCFGGYWGDLELF